MNEINSKINVFDKNSKKFWLFSKVNLIFGYAKSGKSTAISKIYEILSGKDNYYSVNGTQAMPNDYNIIYVNSSEGLTSHLKLNSKSLLRKLIELNTFSKDFEVASKNISTGIETAKIELQNLVSEVLPGSVVKIANEDSMLDLLLDNVSISMDSNSESDLKWNLFNVVESLSTKISNKTIIFFDDFNKDFDEEMTISFFEKIRKSNAIFFLTTRTAFPQYLIENDDSIFAVRDERLIQIPSFEELVKRQTHSSETYHSFEEYMLESGYIEQSGVNDAVNERIKEDQKANILRILTSKTPIVSYKPIPGKVTIMPSNSTEEKIYNDLIESLH